MSVLEELEKMFGSEEVLGVTFVEETPDGPGVSYTAAQYDALTGERPYCESRLPNGGSATRCTAYASLVYARLPGRVKIYGFSNQNNTEAMIVKDRRHPTGHDFAVVDDRYLVDPWIRFVSNADWAKDRCVFDLINDAILVGNMDPKETGNIC